MRTVAVIPARMGSGRLPGKVMTLLNGKPLLGYLLDRVENCKKIDSIVVAIPETTENDCIQDYCLHRSVAVFRGSEEDVLDRVLQSLLWARAELGTLIFSDGPLIDSQVIDDVVDVFNSMGEYDWVGNDLITTWPSGMETEVFWVTALADAAVRCSDAEIREHSTLYIRKNPGKYKLYNLEAPKPLDRPDLSFEVDVHEDLHVISALINQFSNHTTVSLKDLIRFMDDHPELKELTSKVERRWKKFRDTPR